MTLYVESNFVLEIALGQEELAPAERLLAAAETGGFPPELSWEHFQRSREEARTVTCELHLANFAWEAPVAFCDPWPFDFQVLGQLGFLRWFRVVIDAADETFEVIPNA